MEKESRMVVSGGQGEGEMGSYCLMGVAFYFTKWKSSRDLFHKNMNVVNSTESYTSKWLRGYILYSVFFLPQLKKKQQHFVA